MRTAAAMIVTAAVALVLAGPCMVQAQTTQPARADFASQVIGLSMAFYEVRPPKSMHCLPPAPMGLIGGNSPSMHHARDPCAPVQCRTRI